MANVGTADAGMVLQGTGHGSSPTFADLGVNSGLQNHGVVVAQGNAAFVAINPGTLGQVLTSNGNAIDPTFQNAPSGGLTWENEVGDKTMAPNMGYTTSSVSLITVTLPAICAYGSVIRVVGNGTGGWRIAQNAGQVIHFGNIDTSSGVLGFLESTGDYDAVELLCTTANTGFTVINGPEGNITYN